ncbi:oligopeptide ABC transporter ATP-binding protein OppF [Gluconobacter thailandicus NBRC 3257]|uniref:Oligopeptide ABC transporter ATP-binding protein OppF n=1 Tax=Gluconobacter thailandicus NBRC 3257 TaxID=1381097 RepID=A0ABQ0IUN0_GLUTH|nr:ABC transporter ATP-binding protein [Gluconobacter thailandicus]KXV53984.1 ABC transporter ATP-binding protein [Gluconobacter thailandicus]GAC88277.1 oligopeptide ABC transporter ATP-binding protein OppF [Gluconobacter thailandicus NBRC 3255]GAD25875.1 oligopeptide ABC transporter ATP-binding protein OppF [Gluconobacter thailandicus NBRC 3257]
MSVLLEARRLEKQYRLGGGRVLHAVSDVSLQVHRGEALALVGESGCGKSSLGRTLIGLTHPTSGEVLFDGQRISGLSDRALRPWRARMQMVFQDSSAAFNPRRTVGESLAEPLRIHGRKNIRARVDDLLDQVGLARSVADRYPHEFSGGQRQRLNIARALVLGPDLLVADEPVSALDVSVQAQIVNLFRDLRASLGVACVFISHDLSVVRQMADRIAVMYLGSIVEEGDGLEVLDRPAHPYTKALLDAVPRPDRPLPPPLKGDVPSPVNPPSGCRFHTRCPIAQPKCATDRPSLQPCGTGRRVACHYPLVA